jgi:hypothetical protein
MPMGRQDTSTGREQQINRRLENEVAGLVTRAREGKKGEVREFLGFDDGPIAEGK